MSVQIHSITDDTLHPKISANEVKITPVVFITPPSKSLCKEKTVVIELMKTTKLLDPNRVKEIVPLYSNTNQTFPLKWKELGVLEHCMMLKDRICIEFKATHWHFNIFTVVARFPSPTADILVDPNISDPKGQVQLTVSELPGFKVQIPLNSVQSVTKIKATLHYGDPEVCKDNVYQPLASACVQLEPHGQQFKKKVLVQIPILGYIEIIKENPDAKLQLWYTSGSVDASNGSLGDWILDEETEFKISQDTKGDYVAMFYTDHFSSSKLTWSQQMYGIFETIRSIFNRVESFAGRCQVAMTHEADLESVINFSIHVLVYPFQDAPRDIPKNYHSILHDSGGYPVEFSPGKLYFKLELKEYLSVKSGQLLLSKTSKLSESFPARAEFDIDLDKKAKGGLKDGAVLAHLSIDHDEVTQHDCNLIKVIIIILQVP